MIDYIVSWLGCAKRNGLTVDYLGGWNERGYNKAWYENLHRTLGSKGYGNTKVVGDDTGWGVADDMVSDPAFNAAVDIVAPTIRAATCPPPPPATPPPTRLPPANHCGPARMAHWTWTAARQR